MSAEEAHRYPSPGVDWRVSLTNRQIYLIATTALKGFESLETGWGTRSIINALAA